jgi:hypothetical protein
VTGGVVDERDEPPDEGGQDGQDGQDGQPDGAALPVITVSGGLRMAAPGVRFGV